MVVHHGGSSSKPSRTADERALWSLVSRVYPASLYCLSLNAGTARPAALAYSIGAVAPDMDVAHAALPLVAPLVAVADPFQGRQRA